MTSVLWLVSAANVLVGMACALAMRATRRERRLAQAYAAEAECCERLAREILEAAAEVNKSSWRSIDGAHDALHAQVQEWVEQATPLDRQARS